MQKWYLREKEQVCEVETGLVVYIMKERRINLVPTHRKRTAVAQWLRCCATKVAGSIPAVVIGFFIDIKSFRSHYGPEVDPACNRNEYQEYFLGVKAAGA